MFYLKKVLSKERDLKCSVRANVEEKFSMFSIVAVIGVPLALGPILCPFAHIFLTICSCLADIMQPRPSLPSARIAAAVAAESGTTPVGTIGASGNKSESGDGACVECAIIFGFTLIFLGIYPTAMYITEIYFGTVETMFPFIFFKYVVGCLHLIALPLFVLFVKRDIRHAARDTYIKKSTTDDNELTLQQLQENLGIGVNPDV